MGWPPSPPICLDLDLDTHNVKVTKRRRGLRYTKRVKSRQGMSGAGVECGIARSEMPFIAGLTETCTKQLHCVYNAAAEIFTR